MSVKIKNVRLSNNPETKVVDSPEGINNKLNMTSDGDMFCTIELVDNSNLLSLVRRTVTYRQNNGKWKGVSPKDLLGAIGSEYPGARSYKFSTSEYSIGSNKVSSFTSIILPHEDGIKTANSLLKANQACVVIETVNTETGEVTRELTEPANLVSGGLAAQ